MRARRPGTERVKGSVRPRLEALEGRLCLDAAPFIVGDLSVGAPDVKTGALALPNARDVYRLNVGSNGRLTAGVHAETGLSTRLSLLDANGGLLTLSEATSPTNGDDRIDLHLTPGDYQLAVEGLQGAGTYRLTTIFHDASRPLVPIFGSDGSEAITNADLNRDGCPDLVFADYYFGQVVIQFGLGDGTFQAPVECDVGLKPEGLIAADFDGDGAIDLATANTSSDDVSVLLNNGDGTFRPEERVASGGGPVNLVAADFDGDGAVDLAVANSKEGNVVILKNMGDGSFLRTTVLPALGGAGGLAAADFDGDGRIDLACAETKARRLTFFRGNGDGSFVQTTSLAIGEDCMSVVVGDFNGDGRIDVAAANAGDDTVMVFLNRPSGFTLSATLRTGTTPYTLVVVDAVGDNALDLLTSNYNRDVSVFAGKGDGGFATLPRLPVGLGCNSLTVSDFNRDGRPDVATVDFISSTVSVVLGNAEGTFLHPSQEVRPTSNPAMAAADLNGDGVPDLVVCGETTNTVLVLPGRGDGTYREAMSFPTETGPYDVTITDLNEDGAPDLAVANYIGNTVSVLIGRGDGTFAPGPVLVCHVSPDIISAADLDGDGHIDLVAANYDSNDVSVFYGRGNGSFDPQRLIAVGGGPSGVVLRDLNGDGLLDIVTANTFTDDVSVVLSRPGRAFDAATSFPAGEGPWWVVAGDLDGDHVLDLAVSDYDSGLVSVLRGQGDGSFASAGGFGVGEAPYPSVLTDLNGDGRLDLLVGNAGSNDLSFLAGRGDGTFGPEIRLPAGVAPYRVVVADLDRDGRPDIAAGNYLSNSVTVMLGTGPGTWGDPRSVTVTSTATPMVAADFNADGKPDLTVADRSSDRVIVRMGQGDGTFDDGLSIPIGLGPSGVVVTDLNRDGRLDLVATCAGSNDVWVLLGLGDGTFQTPYRLPVGRSPRSPVVADFNSDGAPDVALVNSGDGTISVLYNSGDGRFGVVRQILVGIEPTGLTAATFDSDSIIDLVVADRSAGRFIPLLGLPQGGFAAYPSVSPIAAPESALRADLNGDGLPDIASYDDRLGVIAFWLNNPRGDYANSVLVHVGTGLAFLSSARLDGRSGEDIVFANKYEDRVYTFRVNLDGSVSDVRVLADKISPDGTTFADFNNDGNLDMAISHFGGRVEVLLGDGRGSVLAPEHTAHTAAPEPVVTDWDGDGAVDVFNVDAQGHVLLRLGRKVSPGEFGAPKDIGPAGVSFRDIVVAESMSGPVLLALEAGRPRVWSLRRTTNGAMRFDVDVIPGAVLPVHLTAGEMDRDGDVHVVVLDRGLNQAILLQLEEDGHLELSGPPLAVGFGPTDLTLTDLNHDHLFDLVISNAYSGDISVYHQLPNHTFATEERLAGGIGLAEISGDGERPVRHSPDEPMGVVTGVFGTSGLTDIVSVQRGSNRISLLKGALDGSIADPSLATTYTTGLAPTRAVPIDVNHDGRLDLVVLNEGTSDVSVFLNDGRGGFITMPRVDAGNRPSGLAARDVNGDGVPDLLVTNAAGDLLILLGKGDGTFLPYQRADRSVSIAVGDLTGDGLVDVVLTDTSKDLLSVQISKTNESFLQGRQDGLLAPGPIIIADLNADKVPDLIVVNRGGNSVLVYVGLGGGRFAAPRRYFTGTAPEGLTVADLNKDGAPDLVVTNTGSNDVSILLGQGTGPTWDLKPGPRLQVGERPVATTVVDLNGDGTPDVLCVNEGSDSVTLLLGLGGGFFDDRSPPTEATGMAPIRAFVGRFNNTSELGVIVVNSGSNDLTYYPNFLSYNSHPGVVPSGGIDPIAAVMGDFNKDGFDDLVVAHHDDSLISLILGGADGPILARSIRIDGPVHLTDLVVSGSNAGQIQLFLGAEGLRQAIPLMFSLTAPTYASQTIGANGLAAVATYSATSNNGADEGRLSVGQQFAFATSVVSSVTFAFLTGQSSFAALAISSALQVTTPPSSDFLGALAINLVQVGQAQVSDIIPFHETDLATVAIIQVVSNSPDTSEPWDMLEGNESPQNMDANTDWAGQTPLERFLVGDLARSTTMSLDIANRSTSTPALGSDWVWFAAGSARSPLLALRSTDHDRVSGPDDLSSSATTDPGTILEEQSYGTMELGSAGALSVVNSIYLIVSCAVYTGLRAAWVRLGQRNDPKMRLSAGTSAHAYSGRSSRSSRRRPSLRGDNTGRDLPPWIQARNRRSPPPSIFSQPS